MVCLHPARAAQGHSSPEKPVEYAGEQVVPPETENRKGDLLKACVQSRNCAAKTALSIDFVRLDTHRQQTDWTSLWLGWSVSHGE